MEIQVTHISLKVKSGYNLLTKEEWLELPVTERVQLILQGKAQFLDGKKTVSARSALQFLKAC